MALFILLAILSLPLVELYVLIEVGEGIGGLSTILLCLATAALGLQLIRAQGLGLSARIQEKLAAQEPVGRDMLEGVGLAIAGLSLLIPGFLTDGLGFVLLIPPFRQALAGGVIARIGHQFHQRREGSGIIIEGSVVHVEPEPDTEVEPPILEQEVPILDQEVIEVARQPEKAGDPPL